MCNSFEDVYLTVEDMFLDLNEFHEVYIVEVGKTPKLVSKDDLEQKTKEFNPPKGDERIKRGKKSKLMQYDFEKAPVTKYGQGYGILHYIVKSRERTEKKDHHGYIIYYKSNHRIKELYCDCSDFFFFFQGLGWSRKVRDINLGYRSKI